MHINNFSLYAMRFMIYLDEIMKHKNLMLLFTFHFISLKTELQSIKMMNNLKLNYCFHIPSRNEQGGGGVSHIVALPFT